MMLLTNTLHQTTLFTSNDFAMPEHRMRLPMRKSALPRNTAKSLPRWMASSMWV